MALLQKKGADKVERAILTRIAGQWRQLASHNAKVQRRRKSAAAASKLENTRQGAAFAGRGALGMSAMEREFAPTEAHLGTLQLLVHRQPNVNRAHDFPAVATASARLARNASAVRGVISTIADSKLPFTAIRRVSSIEPPTLVALADCAVPSA